MRHWPAMFITTICNHVSAKPVSYNAPSGHAPSRDRRKSPVRLRRASFLCVPGMQVGVPQRLDRLPRRAYSRVHADRRILPALSPLAPGQRRVKSEHKAGECLRLLLLQPCILGMPACWPRHVAFVHGLQQLRTGKESDETQREAFSDHAHWQLAAAG
jgi:hypothetical protein